MPASWQFPAWCPLKPSPGLTTRLVIESFPCAPATLRPLPSPPSSSAQRSTHEVTKSKARALFAPGSGRVGSGYWSPGREHRATWTLRTGLEEVGLGLDPAGWARAQQTHPGRGGYLNMSHPGAHAREGGGAPCPAGPEHSAPRMRLS
uniref:Uncharacterized protein n=1 Tax=Myotis myotis TaxID=51298 RepID=A0A7J7WVI6_MYOMY|nr:hypothetical protein mMyoMyo1_011874 [Myotis myotis]